MFKDVLDIRYVVLCLMIGISHLSFSKNYLLNIHDVSVQSVLAHELEIESTEIANNCLYYIGEGIAQPKCFQRKENLLPDLIVEYYYFFTDSSLAQVLYEWDVDNFSDKHNNKQTRSFQQAMIHRYESLAEIITGTYGDGRISGGDLSDKARINKVHGLKQSIVWEIDETLKIELSIVISNYYHKQKMITFNPTHRIRLYVRNH